MIDSFIPAELAVAPNPLGLAPNLKLTTIPVDAYTCFELWMPLSNGVLMREEATLLMSDRARIEEICAKLTWLMGARLVGTPAPTFPKPVYHWGEIYQALQQSNPKLIEFNAIGVAHSPQTIQPDPTEAEFSTTWTLCPPKWDVLLLNLHPLTKGFQVEVLPVCLAITVGEMVTKCERDLHLSTSKAVLAKTSSNQR